VCAGYQAETDLAHRTVPHNREAVVVGVAQNCLEVRHLQEQGGTGCTQACRGDATRQRQRSPTWLDW
jgi:hypothetical protein